MSEQTIQDALYSEPVMMDKYTCYSLGATTIRNLMDMGMIKKYPLSKNYGKKPDVIIVDNYTLDVIAYIEMKLPTELNTEKKIEKAYWQEIDVAKDIKANIYIVSDGDKFYWYNPLTGNKVQEYDKYNINMKC